MQLPPSPPGYRILAPIAEGGMAQVFLAERLGAGGTSKLIALKQLLPGLADNAELVRLFLREATIALDLSHGNIATVFELCEADGAQFLAMEYVHGWNFSRVLRVCAEQKRPLGPALSLFVVGEVAKALAYAHERKSDAGQPLGIVHRDVSPANVLLSVEGDVKLADFGIARAAAYSPATTQAWVKGKIPYMSPEQARGEAVDARSDLYSLAVVLYELATARRYVNVRDEMAMLAKIRAGERPSFAEFPPPLAAVLEATLTVDANSRIPSARALHQAIVRALADIAPGVTSDDLRSFIASLGLDPPLDVARLRKAAAPPPSSQAATRNDLPRALSAPSPSPSPSPPPSPSPSPSPPSFRSPPLALLAGIAAALVAAFLRFALTSPPAPPTRLEIRSTTPAATVFIDGTSRGAPPVIVTGAAASSVRVEAPGYAPFARSVDLTTTRDVVIDVTLDRE